MSSGTRIATVGVATFGVSFAAALWLVLLCAAHARRKLLPEQNEEQKKRKKVSYGDFVFFFSLI